jgi:steroid delta-isomerase-like uncharacterized protein
MATHAELARRWYEEVWNIRREATIDELMAADVVGYMEGQTIRSVTEFKRARQLLLDAFPDLAMTVEDVIEEGPKAVVRWQVTATHRGEFLGIAPANCRVMIRGLTWLEFRNGQIVRGWDRWDFGGLLQTLNQAR